MAKRKQRPITIYKGRNVLCFLCFSISDDFYITLNFTLEINYLRSKVYVYKYSSYP
jgi:hypothetical protein